MPFEARCPGDCHQGGFADFDHYCDSAGIKPGEEPVAFAAWLNATSGWDGEMRKVTPAEETPDEFRRRVEANTVDPEDHDYQGDGTSRCPVCLGQMNDHISWDVQP
jgi:hypothetical protein